VRQVCLTLAGGVNGLVNLLDRVVEVHRQPSAGRYGAIERTEVGGVIAPAAFPSLQIAVREIFE
jgi:Uma2 family endonuclease